MLTELGKRMHVQSENFSKELENTKQTKAEIKNSVLE